MPKIKYGGSHGGKNVTHCDSRKSEGHARGPGDL